MFFSEMSKSDIDLLIFYMGLIKIYDYTFNSYDN